MSRPFLLIQARNHDDPMREHEIACFCATMGVSQDELRVINSVDGVPRREDVDACCGVLIGGSGDYSSLDAEPWIDDLIQFTRSVLVLEGKPVFASCFGFQILVRAIGGRMIRDHEHTEMGTVELQSTAHTGRDPLFGDLGPRFDAQVGHKDRAAALPTGVATYAASPLCPVHAIRVGALPIWATQFHPELGKDDLALRYLHYKDKYVPEGAPTYDRSEDDPFVRGLRPSDAACALLARFATWVRAHEPELARAA